MSSAARPVDQKPSLAEVLSRLVPLEEDFPPIEDPPVEPEEIFCPDGTEASGGSMEGESP